VARPKRAEAQTWKTDAQSVLRDYRIAFRSRQASLVGRKEVFSGKAKFGIFGDGKEVAQVAMARAFEKGDFRSGYYRDQTFMMALGLLTIEEFFAQLYAHADLDAEPASGGRQMTAHFATRSLDPDGSWRDLSDRFNSSADISPTGSQMPRLVGLGFASRLYREVEALRSWTRFSNGGNEIAFGTIGNASCAEGMFWESINAIGVLQAPVLVSIWDDGYGISVPNEFQVAKGDVSELLAGFRRDGDHPTGFDIHQVRGWDYAALVETYRSVASTVRSDHVPAIIHVTELTQPQGHSTSGSHERYKSRERLDWERDHDCLVKMREWMLSQEIVTIGELDRIEEEDRARVLELKDRAWKRFRDEIVSERDELCGLIASAAKRSSDSPSLRAIGDDLARKPNPFRRDLLRAASDALLAARADDDDVRAPIIDWHDRQLSANEDRYSSHLTSRSSSGASSIDEIPPEYPDEREELRGFEVLNRCFRAALERHPELVAFGEDVGRLGDVNQGFAGLQEQFGAQRVFDTGIRECTIVGQAIGMAMRGLRPLVEIQYLDYLLYALQILSDDLASLHYRTKGGQKAPVIIRTRGHRLEGIWHSGSPMGGILNLVRGIHVCVPRDMTRAAGMYNTLLRCDDPGLVIEVLNGYRLRESLPSNIGTFTVPLGVPAVLRPGRDVTVVTYGACCRIVLEAAEQLERVGVDTEVIDVQTLLPFDIGNEIVESVRRTGRIVFVDEDVPGGATAFMMQQVIERCGGFWHLDAPPRCVTAKAHRPAYGSDGDYFSKPNRETVFRAVYDVMHESDPTAYPEFYGSSRR
jgi:pyruvate/2-oxoglutarate/acetoin dehydrogenase E1 component/TPP-dependent pyruvate/acetoin dehydrogenase alpha subunit